MDTTEFALEVADELVEGARPRDIVDTHCGDEAPPTPLAEVEWVRELLYDGFNAEIDRIADELADIDRQLTVTPESSPELWSKRHDLTENRDAILRGFDLLVSVPHTVGTSDDELPLEFFGWRMAHVSSRRGKVQRWTELRLYRTLNHRWVCEEVGVSRVPGEVARRTVDDVDTDFHVVQFFGDGPLAASIYENLGLLSPQN